MPHLFPLLGGDPSEIRGYRIAGRLGFGGQGVVYLGVDPDGEQVAIKMLRVEDDTSRAQFAKEVTNARRVAPFCTAQILDFDVTGDSPFVISEFIEGRSLQKLVAERGPLSGPRLHRLAIGTATALAAIHLAGVVHRDLKPANVMMSPEGPRVIDFGIARDLSSRTTLAGQLFGTPAYMSPEQLNGGRIGPASDLFSWASVIVFSATGRAPFDAGHMMASINRIAHQQPDLTGTPEELQPLLQLCFSKQPDERPSAQQTLAMLLDRPVGADTPNASAMLAVGSRLAEDSQNSDGTARPAQEPAQESARQNAPGAGARQAAPGTTGEPVTRGPADPPHGRSTLVPGTGSGTGSAPGTGDTADPVASDDTDQALVQTPGRPPGQAALDRTSAHTAAPGAEDMPAPEPARQPRNRRGRIAVLAATGALLTIVAALLGLDLHARRNAAAIDTTTDTVTDTSADTTTDTTTDTSADTATDASADPTTDATPSPGSAADDPGTASSSPSSSGSTRAYATLPAALSGVWAGTVSQTSSIESYTWEVELDLTAGRRKAGTMTATDLGCVSHVRVRTASLTKAVLWTPILPADDPQDTCSSLGVATVRVNKAGDRVKFVWKDREDRTSKGFATLTRLED